MLFVWLRLEWRRILSKNTGAVKVCLICLSMVNLWQEFGIVKYEEVWCNSYNGAYEVLLAQLIESFGNRESNHISRADQVLSRVYS